MLRTIVVAALLWVMAPISANAQEAQRGLASWYGPNHHGRLMADGKRFNQWAPTVAHRRLPLGTEIVILNLENGKTARATVTDRGPYINGRILDVSRGVASNLDMVRTGVARVEMRVVNRPRRSRT